MPHAMEASCREDLRRVALAGQGVLVRLLALMRTAPETHLGFAEIVRMAAETGLAVTPVELAQYLDTLADHGLLRRLHSIAAEPVFDTVTEPHFHLVYEETGQIIDLHVSPETLLGILRGALAERPEGLEILVRSRRAPAPAGDGAPNAGPGRRRARIASRGS